MSQHGVAIALLILAGALAADWIVGDPPALWRRLRHPVVLLGALIGWLDRRLNAGEHRRLKGVAALAALLLAAWSGGELLAALCRWLGIAGWIVEALLVSVLLAQKSLYRHVADVADGLEAAGLAGGRDAVSRIVGRDPQNLDEAGVCRAAVESCAENFSDGIVGPALWYALLGLPGMIAYKAINTADSMIGHKSDRYRRFGWAAARLDDAVNLLPARLGGLLLTLAALALPGGDARGAVTAMRRDAGRHTSPNAGWPESAMAGALGLRLAGPRRYGERLVDGAWMGDGRADLTAADIRRALRLYALACGLLLALALLLAGIFYA